MTHDDLNDSFLSGWRLSSRISFAASFPRLLLKPGIRTSLLVAAVNLATAVCGLGQAASNTPNATQPASAAISGMVAGPDGEVYQGVRVTLTATGASSSSTQTQTTGADGSFHFSHVSPGPFRLNLASPGFTTQTVVGTLREGEDYEAHSVLLTAAATTSTVQVTASRTEIAQAQLSLEEKQRVLGVLPNYLVTYDPNAAPLTARQKFQLAWKSALDPVSFGAAAFFAGIDQASNALPGYGQGAQGYAKRLGAVYGDSFVGTMIGGAIFPSIFRQDPRYFVMGTGSVRSRVWYAVYTSVMCKGDNGRWQVNYSGLLGGTAASGISQLYYPAGDRASANSIFSGTAIVAGTNIFGNLAQEFVIRRFTPLARKKDPGQL